MTDVVRQCGNSDSLEEGVPLAEEEAEEAIVAESETSGGAIGSVLRILRWIGIYVGLITAAGLFFGGVEYAIHLFGMNPSQAHFFRIVELLGIVGGVGITVFRRKS
jgi:hypothetical protein